MGFVNCVRVIHKTVCILFYFCLKAIWIMIIFFNAHAQVEVHWTSPILIPFTHAHLVKKIQPISMSRGLQFVKKNCAAWAPRSHVNFLKIPCLLGMCKSRYPTNTDLNPNPFLSSSSPKQGLYVIEPSPLGLNLEYFFEVPPSQTWATPLSHHPWVWTHKPFWGPMVPNRGYTTEPSPLDLNPQPFLKNHGSRQGLCAIEPSTLGLNP